MFTIDKKKYQKTIVLAVSCRFSRNKPIFIEETNETNI